LDGEDGVKARTQLEGINLDAAVTELLLSGRASTAAEAEEIYLNEHLPELVGLIASPISDSEFCLHPLVRLLLSRGSRPSEDTLV
jgi:hypothetical protein